MEVRILHGQPNIGLVAGVDIAASEGELRRPRRMAPQFSGNDRESFNGRTADFDSANRGSNPCSRTKSLMRTVRQRWSIKRHRRDASAVSCGCGLWVITVLVPGLFPEAGLVQWFSTTECHSVDIGSSPVFRSTYS